MSETSKRLNKPVSPTPRSHHSQALSELDDEALLTRLHAKDERALEALYDQYGGLVFTLALRIVGDRDLANEVLQDTFLRCWNSVGQYDGGRGRLPAWLMGIARNRAIDLLRSRGHQMRLREDALPANLSTSASLTDTALNTSAAQRDPSEAVLLQHTVKGALADLSAAQRQVIELAYYGGFTQAEIATQLSTPVGTVKTRMRDGMGRLRNTLRSLVESRGAGS